MSVQTGDLQRFLHILCRKIFPLWNKGVCGLPAAYPQGCAQNVGITCVPVDIGYSGKQGGPQRHDCRHFSGYPFLFDPGPFRALQPDVVLQLAEGAIGVGHGTG